MHSLNSLPLSPTHTLALTHTHTHTCRGIWLVCLCLLYNVHMCISFHSKTIIIQSPENLRLQSSKYKHIVTFELSSRNTLTFSQITGSLQETLWIYSFTLYTTMSYKWDWSACVQHIYLIRVWLIHALLFIILWALLLNLLCWQTSCHNHMKYANVIKSRRSVQLIQ